MHVFYTGKSVLDGILSEVKESQCYSLMIDETMDITTKEQMIIYIKYMCVSGDQAELKTRFLGILEVSM